MRVFMLIRIEYLECHIDILWDEKIHVRPNSPPGLGRTQGCGFWVHINGASAGSEAEIRQKTWRQ